MNRRGAKDQAFETSRIAWNNALDTLGLTGEVRFASDYRSTPKGSVYWARNTINTVLEEQETLKCGTRRFVTRSLLIVQLFVPFNASDSEEHLDSLASFMRNAFRTARGVKDFDFSSNAYIRDDVEAEPSWLRANVIAPFSYREFI
jgi:hypothetical protein